MCTRIAATTATRNHLYFPFVVNVLRKFSTRHRHQQAQQQLQQEPQQAQPTTSSEATHPLPVAVSVAATTPSQPPTTTTTAADMPAEELPGATRLEAYVIQKRLAAALFGDVLLCTHTPTGEQVAVKRVLLSAAAAQRTLATDKKVRENVALERALYRHLQTRNSGAGHANVLRLREEIEFDGYLYLVFDYCERGELYELVSATADGKLPVATARKYLRQIAQGVQFVHESGYAHRDLSLENVLVTKDDVCQVCDLGLAAPATTASKETVGKMFYMAPEVLAGVRYEPTKADVWSLGVMLFIMLIGAPPVECAATSDARFRLIAAQGVRTLIARWGLTKDLPAAAIDLLAGMLEADPTQRLSMDAVVAHTFVGLPPSSQQQEPATTTVFRRMASSFPDEILAKQQQMGDGSLDAAASATSTDEPHRRPSLFKRAVNRLLRRRSSKRVMAVSTRETTAVSECGPVRAFSASAAAV